MLRNPVNEYDLIVVGAGPAGLSAARTAARLGFDPLVIERESGPGELNHPCHSIVTPSWELTRGETVTGGLHFPQIDLMIPESLVLARRAAFRCIMPGGTDFPVRTNPEDLPPVMIDRSGLLRLLAREAASAGARFMWGTGAASLIYDGSRVTGVRTSAGDVTAPLVILATGAVDHLVGPHDEGKAGQDAEQHLLVLSQDLKAPRVGLEQLGTIVTLGRLYTSAQAGYGSLVMDAPGRATMIFAMPTRDLDCGTVDHAWQYLAEYAHDPRISGLLSGASVVRRSSLLLPRREGAGAAVQDGLMLTGDAATSAGRLGILPSVYVGRQAALVAAGALDAGDTTSAALMTYDRFLRALVLPDLQADTAALDALLSMDDAELDRLGGLLGWLQLPLPVFLGPSTLPTETVRWLAGRLSLPEKDRNLLARVFSVSGKGSPVPAVRSAYADPSLIAA